MIFISSPYSSNNHVSTEINYREAAKYAATLARQGHIAISPIAYGHNLAAFRPMPVDWEFWKEFCLTFLSKASSMHVLMLDGWKESKGVTAEIEYAEENNIPIKYIKIETNYVEQH
jgi:hypothetical protein